MQPVSVEDMATICADAAVGEENVVLDAAGPETISYDELVRLVARRSARRRGSCTGRAGLVLALRACDGRASVVTSLLTRRGARRPAGEPARLGPASARAASFSSWVAANGEMLGRGYVSELARNFVRTTAERCPI